jgi:hypothetical protein
MPIIIDPKTGLPFPVRSDRAPRNKRQGRVPGPADVAQIDAQVLRDPGVHATPDDFGAGIGKAIEQFGAAAGRVASDFAEMRREAEDDTAAAAGLSEARVRFTRVAESMKTQATTTEGLTGNLGKALFEETDAILRELREVRGFRPSKGGEAAIRRQLGLLASRMVARGAMSEHRIRLAKLGHDVDFSVADAAMAAFDAPGDVFAIIAETEANLARFKNKLPPDILAAKAAAAREMIAGNAVAGLVEQGDVASARALLEAAGSGEGVSLSPDQAGRLRKAVDRVEDQARRARRPAVEAEIEDHLASIQATGAGLGGVTERARAALDRKAFKAFQRNEKDAHVFHETMESLKFAGPEVTDRELETRRPKRGARNFAEKQRRFQVLERGAKQMLNVRARDGAAFVMEMGDVKAAFERAGDDGPSLRRALKFRMAIQSEIGIPGDHVRLLTRAEAGALASEVQSAGTQDKAAKVAGLQDLYGPLFGRAMKELSEAGLDPRFQVLAMARDNPALARAIAQVIGTEHAELEKGLDGAAVKDLRRRLRDLAPDGRSAAGPGGETAGEVKAVLSVAENLALRYLRETGDVEESAARAAAFANDAIEEMRLTAGEETIEVTGGAGDDTLIGDAGGERDENPVQQGNADDEKPRGASIGKNKESLDEVERTYRGYVEIGRKMGLDFAADNLERFLDGKGGTKNITRDEARQFDAIKEAEDTNRTRFEESFLEEGPGPEDTFLEMEDIGSSKSQHTFNAQLKRIKDGAPPINLGTDDWEREFHFDDQLIQLVTGEADFALGVGRTEVKSKGTFTAERKGNVIHIKGTVDHVWEDKYKFKRNQPFADGALALQKHRGARPFDIRAGWKQKVQGTIEIVDGALRNPKFQWTDVK